MVSVHCFMLSAAAATQWREALAKAVFRRLIQLKCPVSGHIMHWFVSFSSFNRFCFQNPASRSTRCVLCRVLQRLQQRNRANARAKLFPGKIRSIGYSFFLVVISHFHKYVAACLMTWPRVKSSAQCRRSFDSSTLVWCITAMCCWSCNALDLADKRIRNKSALCFSVDSPSLPLWSHWRRLVPIDFLRLLNISAAQCVDNYDALSGTSCWPAHIQTVHTLINVVLEK